MLLSAKAFAFSSTSLTRKKHKKAFALYDWVGSLLIGTFAIFSVFTFLIASITVKGSSMEPTFHENDYLFMLSSFYEIEKGDIVVVAQDKTEDKGRMEEPLIKRVIATEGDTVDIDFDKGIVYINGTILQEDYVSEPISNRGSDPIKFPLKVKENFIFVLGDNRNNSRDSRNASVDQMDMRYVYGKVIARYWPTQDFKILQNPYKPENEE